MSDIEILVWSSFSIFYDKKKKHYKTEMKEGLFSYSETWWNHLQERQMLEMLDSEHIRQVSFEGFLPESLLSHV